MLLQRQASRHRQACRQTLQPSSPGSLSLHASGRLARRNPKRPSRMRRTLRPGHTRTSTTDTTSARYAQRRSSGTRAVSGLVGHAGLCSIWAALRSGPRTRAQPLLASKPLRMGRRLRRDSGAVLDATCQRTCCPRTSIVGAKRSLNPRPCQACRHFRAARHAPGPGFYQRAVPILALSPVTLGLVRPAV
jgi:hypothetical protein